MVGLLSEDRFRLFCPWPHCSAQIRSEISQCANVRRPVQKLAQDGGNGVTSIISGAVLYSGRKITFLVTLSVTSQLRRIL